MTDDTEIRERLARIEEREVARDKTIDGMAEQLADVHAAFIGIKWVRGFIVAGAMVAGFFIGVYRDALGMFK